MRTVSSPILAFRRAGGGGCLQECWTPQQPDPHLSQCSSRYGVSYQELGVLILYGIFLGGIEEHVLKKVSEAGCVFRISHASHTDLLRKKLLITHRRLAVPLVHLCCIIQQLTLQKDAMIGTPNTMCMIPPATAGLQKTDVSHQ